MKKFKRAFETVSKLKGLRHLYAPIECVLPGLDLRQINVVFTFVISSMQNQSFWQP